MKKILILMLLALSSRITLAMEKELSSVKNEQKAVEFFLFAELISELKGEIIKALVLNIVKDRKSFNHLKQELDKVKTISRELKKILEDLFSEKFVLGFEGKGISFYQLAKIMLNQEKWDNFKNKYGEEANQAGLEIISMTKNNDYNLNQLQQKLSKANLDVTEEDSYTALKLTAHDDNNVELMSY